MVAFIDGSNGQIHTYAYDPLGRRIRKTVDSAGSPEETRYYYDGWQAIEERDGANVTQATYVYGLYVDEVLNMQRLGAEYYYHTDDNYSVMAVTNAEGAVVERYDYQDYGFPIFMDPTGDARSQSAVENSYLFTGRRYDAETHWYYYRTRYLEPLSGRFTTHDTIGTWGGQA